MTTRPLIVHDANGDQHLSLNDISLWQITYTCLMLYACPVLFKVRGPHASLKLSQYIRFYVPADHPRCAETVAYLQKALASFARPETPATETHDWFYGCFVTISEYSGVGSHLHASGLGFDNLVTDSLEDFARNIIKACCRSEGPDA